MALRSPSAPCLGRVHVLPVFDISYSPTWGHPALISFANHGTRLFLTPPLSSLALVTRFLFRHSSAAALAVRRRVRATNPRVVGSISSMPSRVDPSIIWPRAFFTPVLLVCSLPLLCLQFAPVALQNGSQCCSPFISVIFLVLVRHFTTTSNHEAIGSTALERLEHYPHAGSALAPELAVAPTTLPQWSRGPPS